MASSNKPNSDLLPPLGGGGELPIPAPVIHGTVEEVGVQNGDDGGGHEAQDGVVQNIQEVDQLAEGDTAVRREPRAPEPCWLSSTRELSSGQSKRG